MNIKKLVAIAAVGSMGLGVMNMTPVSAATPKTGDTTVSYSNENIVPDPTGGWEVVIPTNINFKDADIGVTKTDYKVLIRGLNGGETAAWKDGFKVDTLVASKNGATPADAFKLKSATSSEKAEYKLIVSGMTFTPGTVAGTGTIDPLTKTDKELPIEITLTKGASTSGTYIDTLNFTFTPNMDTVNG